MAQVNQYEITQEYFTKNDCYNANRKIKPVGIMVHSVGCKGTTVNRWRRWNCSWKKGETNRQVCVHAFVDTNTILQCLPWDHRAWHCAGAGNNTHISFEICEPSTSKDDANAVKELYGRTLFLCVYLCKMYNIKPVNVITHCEGHRLGIANNHADVNHWWGKKGTAWEYYTMDRLRRDVALELAGGSVENIGNDIIISPIVLLPILKKGSKGAAVEDLQKLLLKHGYNLGRYGVDGDFGSGTKNAVEEFQKNNGLFVDGIVGQATWKSLKSDKPVVAEQLFKVSIIGITNAELSSLKAAYGDKISIMGA